MGGGDQSFARVDPNAIGTGSPQQPTQNIFAPTRQFMPKEYFGSAPIFDPSPILNAYMQNMPAFLQAERGPIEPQSKAYNTTSKTRAPSLITFKQ